MPTLRQSRSKNPGYYMYPAFLAMLVVLGVNAFLPGVIPFSFFEFWRFSTTLPELLSVSWPILLWGAGISGLFLIFSRNDPRVNDLAEDLLRYRTLISLQAGVFEEIAFRWLLFYCLIFTTKLGNFLFFGFAGFGITEWFCTTFLIPLANFGTAGFLAPILFSSKGWAVGAAVIFANGKFRNGHAYNGFIGWTNSWFLGMAMFFLMFNYGLLAAMLIHFLYDFLIFFVVYIDSVIERAMGNRSYR